MRILLSKLAVNNITLMLNQFLLHFTQSLNFDQEILPFQNIILHLIRIQLVISSLAVPALNITLYFTCLDK